jgi:hypothetical protein
VALTFPEDSDFLPTGVHQATVEEVEQVLVAHFPESTTRKAIFDEWIRLRTELATAVSLGRQWLNGSFVSKKENPNDLDLVTFADPDEVEALDRDGEDRLGRRASGRRTERFPHSDSYLIVEYADGHPLHANAVSVRPVPTGIRGEPAVLNQWVRGRWCVARAAHRRSKGYDCLGSTRRA